MKIVLQMTKIIKKIYYVNTNQIFISHRKSIFTIDIYENAMSGDATLATKENGKKIFGLLIDKKTLNEIAAKYEIHLNMLSRLIQNSSIMLQWYSAKKPTNGGIIITCLKASLICCPMARWSRFPAGTGGRKTACPLREFICRKKLLRKASRLLHSCNT